MARYWKRSRKGGYRASNSSSQRYSSKSPGQERALQHIREANELSHQLGGTDKDVKAYFFELSGSRLADLFASYGQKYGDEAKQYAEETLGAWKSGRRKMSGMVASRLFNLLPPTMPLADKYQLTENLWRHVGPSSKRLVRVGLDATLDDAVAKVQEHIEQVVTNYVIPEALANRFEWISAGDVQLKQKLLNHMQQLEKTVVIEGARQQLPVMLGHLRSEAGKNTTRLAQILTFGKHELEIRLDRDFKGAALEDWKPQRSETTTDKSWLWWLVAIAALFLFLAFRK